MMVEFTPYANTKFEILARHRFSVTEAEVQEVLLQPEGVDETRAPLLVAHKRVDPGHALKVVYRGEKRAAKVITFYPVFYGRE